MAKRRGRWIWLLLTGGLFLVMLWTLNEFRRDFYVSATGKWYRKRILIYLAPVLLSMVCSQCRPKIAEKWNAAVRALFILAAIVLSEVAFQNLCWNTLWNGRDIPMRTDCLLMNLSLTAVVFTAVWLLVWDSRRAALSTYWMMSALGYLYRCVFDFRGSVFKITDLATIGTGAAVAGHYTWGLQSEQVFWIACGVLLWVISQWIPRQKCRTRKARIGKAACVLAACSWIGVLMYSPLLDAMQISTQVWHHEAVWNNGRQGVLTTLMKEIQNASDIRPQDYQISRLQKVDDRLMQSGMSQMDTEKPNVIVIMNEALADLQSLWQTEAAGDALPFLHSLRGETVWGHLYVSSYGGETCNTEHSFLTGTMPSPNLAIALLSTVRENTPSLAWQLKSLGYKTVAIHPENPSNYQRDEYYPRLGLDTFISAETFEKAYRLRGYVSDSACYEKIIAAYRDKEKDEKLFVFNVTMQNHGPYDAGGLQEYLDSIRQSDRAFEELTAYFEEEEEPVVVLMFGDHQPRMGLDAYEKQAGLSDTAQRFTQYITPFVIWANYPIEAKYVEAISVNYLSALLLETAGLPMTGYDEWLLDVAQQYPVVNLYGWGDAQGQSELWDSNAKNWPQKLQQLNDLRYNRLYDDKNRLPALRRLGE